MAILYSETASDKGGRAIGKGGNRWIETTLSERNRVVAIFLAETVPDGVRISWRPSALENWRTIHNAKR